MIGIELFAGAGGMATGARQAGVNISIAIENDAYAAQTYLKNHPDTTVVIDNIENVTEFRFDRNDEPVVLFGGPPCQGYSYSNRKTRNIQNPKNWLFKEFTRCAELIMPDWIVMENVPGLKRMDNGFFLKTICDDLRNLGYTPNVKILNAVDFGVPQKRERLFIVASREGIVFDFPEGLFRDNPVTVRDAISDLPKLENGSTEEELFYKSKAISNYAKLLRGRNRKSKQNLVSRNSDNVLKRYEHIRQGNNWKDIPRELMANYKDHSRCHSSIYRRLNENSPAVIISNYRKSMLIHPTENRGLSVREAARLQSFPDSYEFVGSLDQKQQQVGNAVPPLLAKAIFKQLKNY
ncbi:DNA cytosine methyltransferase [uncultured Draconibacterium sp.]|uniref:DNA cytosine methyltransferase n=1 Tax=uncultured Draconibacterium sp. TaxID=1573823 RepID=UPI0029C7F668|nr:DNA cytosine methyltransferase [uncultured Draconibacterium sp.]